MSHLRTIRAKRVNKPYVVILQGQYPQDGGSVGYWNFATKSIAFREAAKLSAEFGEPYWVLEVSYKPLLGP